MAREVHKFAVTVPAGTLQAAPQVTALAMPPRRVTEVEIIVPPGPRGAVGFQLAAAGRQMIPYEPGAFFITDFEAIKWPLEEQISSGAWQMVIFNTGQYSHTLEIRFLVELPTLEGAGRRPEPIHEPRLSGTAPRATLAGMETPLAFIGHKP